MKISPDYDIAILGGGLAGLTAALYAARAGHAVAVFEKGPHAGGRATTQETDGFYFNQGPHAVYRAGEGRRILGELGIIYSGSRATYDGSWVIHQKSHHPLPGTEESVLNSPFLTEAGKAELLALRARLANGYPTRDWDHRTVREWLDTEIAQPEVRALMEGQLRLSTYCNEPSLQSAGAALDQLLVGAADGVDYLDGGWQSLVAALEKAAIAAGAVILTRHAVSEINAQTEQVSLRFADGSTSIAKVVISTLPPEVIARLAGTGQAPALQRWAESLTPVYAACLDIALQHLPQPDHQFAIGLDEPLYYSVHTRSARLAPEGGALIQLAKYLDRTSATEGKPEDIRAELEALMDRFQPGWREVLVHQRFLPRMLVTHAVVTPAGRPPVQGAGFPNLLLAGDWVGPHGMLVDTSLSSARDAAQSALDWLRRQDQDQPARATLLTA